jgi:hypothetical protein
MESVRLCLQIKCLYNLHVNFRAMYVCLLFILRIGTGVDYFCLVSEKKQSGFWFCWTMDERKARKMNSVYTSTALNRIAT